MADTDWLTRLAELAAQAVRLAAIALAALALAIVALIGGAIAVTASLASRLLAELARLLRAAIPWAQQLGHYIARGLALLTGAGGIIWATFTIWQTNGATWIALLLAATIIATPAAFGLGVTTSHGVAIILGLTAIAVAILITHLPTAAVPLAITARTITTIAVLPHLFTTPTPLPQDPQWTPTPPSTPPASA